MNLDAGCLGQCQQLAAEVDEVVRISLMNGLKTRDVCPEGRDDVMLLGVLGFEPLDVYRLRPELVSERILALSAGGQIGN